jgi:hypothetical protein
VVVVRGITGAHCTPPGRPACPPAKPLSDAPITVNRVATATPTISADAVAAVRRGLRSALSLASRPPRPRSAAIGVPSTAAAGRTGLPG